MDILILGLIVDDEVATVFEQTVALLSCERYEFNPAATVDDSKEIEFNAEPPPLLLLKQVSTNKFEIPFQIKGVDNTKSKFPTPVEGV